MYIDVGNGHRIYCEEYGNPMGIKILFLHGGPGVGYSEKDKTLFDPEKFHVVFFDQRGCGRSLPNGEINHNTTQDLLADINKILDYLEMDKVIVFGGSWGSTLGILFAATSPHRVNKLILRGFFPAIKECVDLLLRGGIKDTHPSHWERILSMIPQNEKSNVPEFVFKSICNRSPDYKKIGYEWSKYVMSLSRKQFLEGELDRLFDSSKVSFDSIKIKLSYALNGFFFPEGHVYNQAARIKDIPSVIIHGTFDHLCPLKYAVKLKSTLSNSKLIVVDAGHSTEEKEIKEALMSELDLL